MTFMQHDLYALPLTFLEIFRQDKHWMPKITKG